MSSPSLDEKTAKKLENRNEDVMDGNEGDAVGDPETKPDIPLASISEVFSFAETTETKIYIALGIMFSVISGLSLPASIFYFSSILGDISAIQEEGLEPVLGIVYAMMILGCVSLVSETLQCK